MGEVLVNRVKIVQRSVHARWNTLCKLGSSLARYILWESPKVTFIYQNNNIGAGDGSKIMVGKKQKCMQLLHKLQSCGIVYKTGYNPRDKIGEQPTVVIFNVNN